MCDDKTFHDIQQRNKQSGFTRREFGQMSAVAGLGAMLPKVANAQAVTESDVLIETPDGTADCYFVHPSGQASAAVLVWPDIFGLRPAFRTMGKRLAESGYAVLVVNPFYRSEPAPVVPEEYTFDDVREKVFGLAGTLNADTHFTDARAFIGWLDQQEAVDTSRKVGTTGYCMGGPMIMRTAAAVPERVGAAASFHGGGLATDAADSPHLLIPQMQADFLFAIAENDDADDPQAKETLRESFDEAGLNAEIEVYEGTLHGWCALDSQAYNEEQAERAWSRLLALFENALA